jgi:hypothetical protein
MGVRPAPRPVSPENVVELLIMIKHFHGRVDIDDWVKDF